MPMRSLLILLLLLPMTVYTQQNYGEYLPNSSTIVYYKMNESDGGYYLYDYGPNAIIMDLDDYCNRSVYNIGRIARGLFLNDEMCNGDVVYNGQYPTLRPSGDFTISFWYRMPSDIENHMTVFFTGMNRLDGSNSQWSGILVDFPEANMGLHVSIMDTISSYSLCDTWSEGINFETWYYFTVVSSSIDLRVYKNGHLDNTSSCTQRQQYRVDTTTALFMNTFMIGADKTWDVSVGNYTYYNRNLYGNLDEFIFESRAWSAKEVRDRYNYYMSRFGSRIQSN